MIALFKKTIEKTKIRFINRPISYLMDLNRSIEYLICYEYVYEKDNTLYMEVCIRV